jgi:hypothetical protein
LCFFGAALAGRAFALDFGLALDFEMTGWGAAFADPCFAADFAGAVFLPWLPEPPLMGFPSAS